MAQMQIQDQDYLINRTIKFLEKYGVTKKWLAAQVNISVQRFSYFLHSHFALSEKQYECLTEFLNDYERRMVGFAALED